ncbi:MAG TPA: hypothetical protein VFQ53_42285 [Kofleriaceae bacterium]|nr:hypothetical protein [Kofleriaceae bacterium]
MRRTFLVLLVVVSACEQNAAAPAKSEADEPARKLAGVFPDRFDCASIATTDVLTQLLGASVKAIDTPSSVPRGLPRPCTYEVATTPNPEYWTYDFDCRDGYKQRADALFDQYKRYNADRIDQYNKLSDAGALKPNDAGIEYKQPGAPVEVDVGAKGLDHNDQGLIFIDDDAPCYVRVIGPDATKRLELAKLVAKNLTYVNAPMTPRPLK